MRSAISPEGEATVLRLNLQEIGEVLGVGAARVCQIKKAALQKLSGALDAWTD